eukprot:CAMPEP_0202695502 /NCGR_PEP_ID=MMETSP1385-20130828/9088_1 /ASSEMBLY_ACC=CAM_ASM_000861 /TAXON_ID=933848 /ORGANISM="Elphidium margaritaceum" /LENGTH=374 /DNA_ID=CAMNT_0049351539 /DNA_START=37 /DNA_END=1158 /DNA_ORIENTATION=-
MASSDTPGLKEPPSNVNTIDMDQEKKSLKITITFNNTDRNKSPKSKTNFKPTVQSTVAVAPFTSNEKQSTTHVSTNSKPKQDDRDDDDEERKRSHSHRRDRHRPHSHSRSPSPSHLPRSQSRSRSSSQSRHYNKYDKRRPRDRDRDHSHSRRRRSHSRDRDRDYNRTPRDLREHEQHFQKTSPSAPSPRHSSHSLHSHRDRAAANRSNNQASINDKVMAALNDIQAKHKESITHPLDIKQQQLKRNKAGARDKAMIFAASSGNFWSELLSHPQFQKNISLALKTTNKEFDIATLFKEFSNFHVKLVWLDCSEHDRGVKKTELLTFRDLIAIRSYRKELNHCDALWKFMFYEQRDLFWSMAIYYALLKTTLVPQW